MFRHHRGIDSIAGEHVGGAGRGQDVIAELPEARDWQNRASLIAVCHGDKDRPRGGQAAVRGVLALGKGQGESTVNTHDFAGRAHFRTQNRINDVALWRAEALKREDGFFDRHRMPGRHGAAVASGHNTGGNQLGNRFTRHEPCRCPRQRDPEAFRHKRHGSAGSRVGFQHIEHSRRDRELHVE
ncbi:MAG: Uncharacterised protein [Cellulomonadaceae bacterium TMED98]|nr:MAG: Uncharacterised protein [Cellulomonadaceae bacterium TMED98]